MCIEPDVRRTISIFDVDVTDSLSLPFFHPQLFIFADDGKAAMWISWLRETEITTNEKTLDK